ncbi:MAG: hypothetical protein MUO24_11560 [Desulfobacterales bacterium]|nr:hypothetical protein [Desulfobacterales bacterium]
MCNFLPSSVPPIALSVITFGLAKRITSDQRVTGQGATFGFGGICRCDPTRMQRVMPDLI